MPTVIGIRFRRAGKLYYFSPGKDDFRVDDYAVVNSGSHPQLGRVVLAPTELAADELKDVLKDVERKGTSEDLSNMKHFEELAEKALETFRELARDRDLPVTPLQAEYSFDGAILTFQFSAEEQVDYQSLARELAEILETRVELRQVGARDRARLADGMGRCGLSLCCSTWLIEPGNVTVKMAKDQTLPLHPAKISGVCGRLLCCLRYEHEMYLEGPLTTDGDFVKPEDEVQDLFERATSGRNRYVPDDELASNFLATGLESEAPVVEPAQSKENQTGGAKRRGRSRRRRRRRR